MVAFCFLTIFIENCVDMVIYLKESDYNRLIVEGKTYKKSQIKLREDVDANISSAKNKAIIDRLYTVFSVRNLSEYGFRERSKKLIPPAGY